MKSLTSAVLVLLLAACTGQPSAPKSTTTKTVDAPTVNHPAPDDRDTAFRPERFASFPDTLRGCSSYFTYDTMKVETGNYIFMTNYRDLAMIRVAGKEIYLHKDTANSSRPTEDKAIDVYRGEGYTVVLETQRVGTIDEVSSYTGTLRITSDRVNGVYRVHGEGGC